MDKKGVELTLNVIIVAAILLIVMVVIILMFTGFIGRSNQQLTDISHCRNMGTNEPGECADNPLEGYNCIYRYGGCGKEGSSGDYCCWSKD